MNASPVPSPEVRTSKSDTQENAEDDNSDTDEDLDKTGYGSYESDEKEDEMAETEDAAEAVIVDHNDSESEDDEKEEDANSEAEADVGTEPENDSVKPSGGIVSHRREVLKTVEVSALLGERAVGRDDRECGGELPVLVRGDHGAHLGHKILIAFGRSCVEPDSRFGRWFAKVNVLAESDKAADDFGCNETERADDVVENPGRRRTYFARLRRG